MLGVRDYVRKCGFKRAVVGLSGGIDSALTAAIAAAAIGPEHVLGVAMPSRYSSDHSREDAAQLVVELTVGQRQDEGIDQFVGQKIAQALLPHGYGAVSGKGTVRVDKPMSEAPCDRVQLGKNHSQILSVVGFDMI